MTQEHIIGCILGTAIGDAIGLPYEGVSRRRAVRLLGPIERHRLFFGRGMVSDDTEQTCMVAQSLIDANGNTDVFSKSLAWRFRFWFLGFPAGIGFATLRSCIKLCIGFSPKHSGVFSAGNGPAVRAAIFGAAIDDAEKLRELVRASSRLTHTDPKAEYGAFAIALAAQVARQHETVSSDYYLEQLQSAFVGEGDELIALLKDAARSVKKGESTESFADTLGLHKGVSGYVYHSVPVAIHAWLANPQDYHAAVTSIICCGGDADSTGAIVGGIVGTAVGKEGIPSDWLNKLIEWPRSVSWMEKLGEQLASSIQSQEPLRSIRLPAWGILLRNAFFFLVVLFHGFRRLLPPY